MKIVHVTSDLSKRRGAGVCKVVEELSASQARLGYSVHVVGLDSVSWQKSDRKSWKGAEPLAAKVIGSPKFGFAPKLKEYLFELSPDVVHLHGLWMYPTLAVLSWQRYGKKPFMISPHGMLSPLSLSYSPVKKKVARIWFQDKALGEANCIHATSLNEVFEIRRFGLTQPIALISNGISLERCAPLKTTEKSFRVLSLGRIHKKKGLDRLLDAWALLPNSFKNWQLEIVGPEEGGYGNLLRQKIVDARLSNVSISGPVYGAQKLSLMSTADIFVLPTRNDNFALTVAESLMLKVPVISTRDAPWEGLERNQCGLWVESSVQGLKSGLVEMMSKPKDQLRSMGSRGRSWMLRDFCWSNIATKFIETYSCMMNSGADYEGSFFH